MKYLATAQLLSFVIVQSHAFSFLDNLFRRRVEAPKNTDLDAFPAVPYELDEKDEKFLAEASQLAKLNLSELDLCHHRIILKLRSSCHELNADDMGKLAVMLLNCQSAHEGRKLFPCTENMTLKQCTQDMGPDVWNSYHLMTNRVKAVCSSVRTDQFRGLTELTVNKLMTTSHEQIHLLGELAENQNSLKDLTNDMIDQVSEKSEKLVAKQAEIEQLVVVQKSKLEQNLGELNLITSGQLEVARMLDGLRGKIDDNLKQLDSQASRSKMHYNSIVSDLQNYANEIAMKIEATNAQIVQHQKVAMAQYDESMAKLKEINETIYSLADLIYRAQEYLERIFPHFDFATTVFFLVHLMYLLIGMLSLSFIQATNSSRLILVIAVPTNFLVTYTNNQGLGILPLLITIFTLNVSVYIAMTFGPSAYSSVLGLVSMQTSGKEMSEEEPSKNGPGLLPNRHREPSQTVQEEGEKTFYKYERSRYYLPREASEARASETYSSKSGTPFSLTGERLQCLASTQKGGQCRNAARDGDYCRIHRNG